MTSKYRESNSKVSGVSALCRSHCTLMSHTDLSAALLQVEHTSYVLLQYILLYIGSLLLYNYKQAKYTLNREIRVAKKNYSGKLKQKPLSSNDPTSVWKGLKAITSYKTPSPSTEANQQLAEDLNEFYCRFEKQKPGLTPHTHSDRLTTQPSTPSPSLLPTVFQPVTQDL